MLKRQILLDQADPNGSLPSIAFQKTDSQHTAPFQPVTLEVAHVSYWLEAEDASQPLADSRKRDFI